MARIPLIESDHAPAAVQDIYARLAAGRSDVLNVMKVFAHDPPFLAGFAQMIEALYGDPLISPRHRELAWLRTSQVNACHY
jgi:alkylhydroperoxidase family enzyme